MKKPSIPPPTALPTETARVIWPIKQILDDITGVRSGAISQLDPAATLPEVVATLNQLIARLDAGA